MIDNSAIFLDIKTQLTINLVHVCDRLLLVAHTASLTLPSPATVKTSVGNIVRGSNPRIGNAQSISLLPPSTLAQLFHLDTCSFWRVASDLVNVSSVSAMSSQYLCVTSATSLLVQSVFAAEMTWQPETKKKKEMTWQPETKTYHHN